MSKINDLRAQRAKTWEQTKAFLDSHRNDKGVLSAEDTATYEKMEKEIVDLGHEIERQERLDAFERELNTPVNTPITQKPDTAKVATKTGRASDAYKKAFWAQARTKGGMLTAEIRNALQEGVDTEGGYNNYVRIWVSEERGTVADMRFSDLEEAMDFFEVDNEKDLNKAFLEWYPDEKYWFMLEALCIKIGLYFHAECPYRI